MINTKKGLSQKAASFLFVNMLIVVFDICLFFAVFGLKAGEWEPFQMRRDYEAFLVRRK